jgi:hypothetical protein
MTNNKRMNATIYSHLTTIGAVDLQVGDEGMGCVFGQFIPNDYYFKYIQKYVWEFWATNKPDYNKWHSLRFNAQLDNGIFLFPEGGYTFDDFPEFPNEPKRIDIAGVDLDLFSFAENTLLDPWSSIDITQKISFEDELIKEITQVKSLFNFLSAKRSDSHILVGAEFSTFAKHGLNDEVLFRIKKGGEESRFATVQLNGISRKKEHSSHLPTTQFYIDFDDFFEKRMKPSL